MFTHIKRVITAIKMAPIIESEILSASIGASIRRNYDLAVLHKAEKFGIAVYHDEQIIRAKKFLFASVIQPTEFAVKLLGSEDAFVVVDDRFLMLSPESQEAMIYHEIGHVQMGHMPTFTEAGNAEERLAMSRKGVIDYREIEADDYAASIVGNKAVLNALLEMDTMLPTDEFWLRIKRFKKLVKQEKMQMNKKKIAI